jgi:hypothetical protein
MPADESEELAAGAILENIIKLSLSLEGGVEFDDEGVAGLRLHGEKGTSICRST